MEIGETTVQENLGETTAFVPEEIETNAGSPVVDDELALGDAGLVVEVDNLVDGEEINDDRNIGGRTKFISEKPDSVSTTSMISNNGPGGDQGNPSFSQRQPWSQGNNALPNNKNNNGVQLPINKNKLTKSQRKKLKYREYLKSRMNPQANIAPNKMMNALGANIPQLANLQNNQVNPNWNQTNPMVQSLHKPNQPSMGFIKPILKNRLPANGMPNVLPKKPLDDFTLDEKTNPLTSAIVEEDYPDVRPLTIMHLDIIRKMINFEIDRIADETCVPRFLQSYVKNGVIIVTASDEASLDWLKSTVPLLSPNEGIRLKILSVNELDKLHKVDIFVPNEENKVEILNRIQKQNPDMNMESWHLYSETICGGDLPGILLTLGIPEISLQKLKQKNFMLFHGMDQVNVHVI